MSPTSNTLSRKKIVIWGAAGHARAVAEIIRAGGKFDLVGFLDDTEKPELAPRGFTLFRDRDQLLNLMKQGIRNVVVGIGDNVARLELAHWAESQGFCLTTVIHPAATIACDAQIDYGSVIAAAAVINTGARIGKNVIINTAASVDHDCVLEDGVHLSPGVHLAGYVRIKRATWIGIGSAIIDHVTVGCRSTIGAGSVVVTDLPDGVIAYGVPARVIRANE